MHSTKSMDTHLMKKRKFTRALIDGENGRLSNYIYFFLTNLMAECFFAWQNPSESPNTRGGCLIDDSYLKFSASFRPNTNIIIHRYLRSNLKGFYSNRNISLAPENICRVIYTRSSFVFTDVGKIFFPKHKKITSRRERYIDLFKYPANSASKAHRATRINSLIPINILSGLIKARKKKSFNN